MISPVDSLGFAAGAASLVAIASSNMIALRIAMIFSNLLFIAWGALGMLLPALVLHSILLPINLFRLWQLSAPARHRRRWFGGRPGVPCDERPGDQRPGH